MGRGRQSQPGRSRRPTGQSESAALTSGVAGFVVADARLVGTTKTTWSSVRQPADAMYPKFAPRCGRRGGPLAVTRDRALVAGRATLADCGCPGAQLLDERAHLCAVLARFLAVRIYPRRQHRHAPMLRARREPGFG